MAVEQTDSHAGKLPRQRLVVGLLLLTALAVLALVTDVRDLLTAMLEWVRGQGPLGVAVYGLVFITTVLLLIPATFLTLGAGATFGLTIGFPLVWLSATAAATGACLLGRSLARSWVEEKLVSHPRLALLDQAVGKSGWKIVLLSRLSPLFPFTLVNYAFGPTRIPMPQYILATAVGLFPGILLYVWIGDTLGQLAGIKIGEAIEGPWQWAFYGIGFGVTVFVTLYVARLARRALREDLE